MTISAQIIADSISGAGIRLTTFQLRYPRFIHAELMTHRVFSRNASSSRAIPVKKMIEDLRRDPAMPVYWGSNKPGMQAGEEVEDVESCKQIWLAGRDHAIVLAESLIEGFQLHKQIANRILEPWAHINVVVTATDWQNFFTLRRHKDAQPELKVLADMMFDAMTESQPNQLKNGEWHLPYIGLDELEHRFESHEAAIPVSVARCARVSYLTHDGRQTTIEEDQALYDRLIGAQPLHASPAEHQATPDEALINGVTGETMLWGAREQHGNFRGWIQFRKTLVGEFIRG